MVTQIGLLQTVYDELKVVVANNTGVSTPDDHVGLIGRSKDIQTPFFGFEWTLNPVNRGLGGNIRNGALYYDNNENVTAVDKVRDYEAIIDIGVVVDGDNPRQVVIYMDDVQQHFSTFVDNAAAFHTDAARFYDNGSFPSNLIQPRDAGVRQSYAIEYEVTKKVDLPAAETVDWGVDVTESTLGDTDAYPEKY